MLGGSGWGYTHVFHSCVLSLRTDLQAECPKAVSGQLHWYVSVVCDVMAGRCGVVVVVAL